MRLNLSEGSSVSGNSTLFHRLRIEQVKFKILDSNNHVKTQRENELFENNAINSKLGIAIMFECYCTKTSRNFRCKLKNVTKGSEDCETTDHRCKIYFIMAVLVLITTTASQP